MAERGAIIELWRKTRGTPGVLATLVRVEGSSYRRPGAHMYIQSGGYAGSISGGCLEGDVARKAQWLTRHGAIIETYSTRFDNPFDESTINTRGAVPVDETEIPYGLGCGGVIDLLLEPGNSPEANAMLLALEAAERGESFYSATLLPSPGASRAGGERVILREDGSTFFASANLSPDAQARLAGLTQQNSKQPFAAHLVELESAAVFIEPILPPTRLVIFGAGEDARPLARMAHLLGWRIEVADGRATLAQAARFPEATQVLALSNDSENLHQLGLTNRDAVVLLTHSFYQDKSLLRRLLPLELRYLGLIGACHRSLLLLTEVAQLLGWRPEECLRRIHTPIGLELGGDSPEAVALAIVAEIQSVLHEKHPASRGMTEEVLSLIPDRPYIPTQCPLDGIQQPDDVTLSEQ